VAPLEEDFEHGDAEEASDHVRAHHDNFIILCVSSVSEATQGVMTMAA
jgi:hypothetical protein